MAEITVISSNVILSRMLQLELKSRFDTEVTDVKTIPQGSRFVIYDADSMGSDAQFLKKLGSAARVVVISSSEPDGSPFARLRPPFETSALFSLLDKARSGADTDIYSSLVIDKVRRGVLFNNDPIDLTRAEFEVLSLLYGNKGSPVGRDEIKRAVCKGEKNAAASNSADVYIRFLRKKLDEAYGIRLIKTVRGKGYMLD